MTMTKALLSAVLLVLATSALAFRPPHLAASRHGISSQAFDTDEKVTEHFDPLNLSSSTVTDDESRSVRNAAVAAVALLTPMSASAAGPDWGIFEGRTLSLLHPASMLGMAALSVSTALLGFQWRRQRTISGEINELKAQLPNLNGAKTVSEALAAAQSAEMVDTSYVASLRAATTIENEINALTQERKDLAANGPRDKHFNQGSTLLFLGTFFAIEGPLNTYARAGKLFPGPHLYAGAGCVVLWALAASCVPAMQKGDDTARTAHIGANILGLGLFAWQIQSGIPILLKVIQFTKWP
ncbi:hypothetical protein THAOC_19276 [Thalassiosira oceanica]|uniref:DUF4079 domain-containing protein n=1 Tax=Thalassiosira oceanica TaxID=159749 RepID=K0SPQ1_THAOC|nr:hypothetical protein THAOC_19276 [Thalassiosira oceanica]|eukprot:EJK60382.1 hypothetical protein THAOC_19276 [Thalassiosira oceanica]